MSPDPTPLMVILVVVAVSVLTVIPDHPPPAAAELPDKVTVATFDNVRDDPVVAPVPVTVRLALAPALKLIEFVPEARPSPKFSVLTPETLVATI